MNKYLIINADDFGYNTQQNTAITGLLTNKLITSTSLMCVAPDAGAAAQFAADNHIPAGVHLTINSDDSEKRWQSISKAASLSDEKGLFSSASGLALHAKRADVREELEAQYKYLTDRSVEVDHADNHCATLYGINGRRFYLDAYDFCSKHSLPYRFPKSPGFIERQLGRKVPKPVTYFQKMIVNAGLKKNVRMLDDLVSNPWSIDRIKSYEVLRKYYLDAVDNCMPGITEMFLHPALPLGEEISEWTKRVYEYELLKSGDILERARRKDIEIVSWAVFNTPEKEL